MNTKVSNCITYIPQDIKLELNNGTLTLKAGSKLYVPNGFESDGTTKKFDVKIIESDLTRIDGGDSSRLLYYQSNEKRLISVISNYSGPSAPTVRDNICIWYDTTNNIVKRTDDKGVSWNNYDISLPLSLLTIKTDIGITSIDQVFNGFGYIGSTIYALPGVKGLIPNGRNADGSLKNIEVIINDVKIISDNAASKLLLMKASGDLEYAYGNFYIRDSLPVASSSYERCFVVPENQMYYHDAVSTIWSKRNYIIVGNMNKNYTENITSFTPKTVFHALDYNDKSTISGWSMPSSRYIDLTLGASESTYTAPANGWFAFARRASAVGQFFNVSYISPAKITFWSDVGSGGVGNILGHLVPVQKGQIVKVSYNAGGDIIECRFIYAEGEK